MTQTACVLTFVLLPFVTVFVTFLIGRIATKANVSCCLIKISHRFMTDIFKGFGQNISQDL